MVKTHAFGNDFLLVEAREVETHGDRAALARAVCDRHRGVGADGLIIYTPTRAGAAMQLLNADGSYSEVSGNGVRCLAAWLARGRGESAAAPIEIETDAGTKSLTLLKRDGLRYTFRAAMGQPEHLQLETIDVDGVLVEAVTLRVGNPQCVVLGDVNQERLYGLASKLAVHGRFPEGTNVELAHVEAPDRVRILIWERGVGPTEASGTGACAAAVAAMRYGGASRGVHVLSPGGSQRVEWTDEGLFLTGWAEIIAEVTWLAAASARG
ncbi:MAG TPA: diaminopimelate epimerase [Vicinamibacterales bacterium]